MTLTPREAFERGTDMFNAHDLDGFAAVIADDVEFTAPGGIRGQGRNACAEFFASWFRAFPDAQVDIRNVYFLDDCAVEQGTFTGTHDGILHTPSGDLSPTGKAVSVQYIQMLRFRDGHHTAFHLMFDRLEMLEQLELIPDPTHGSA